MQSRTEDRHPHQNVETVIPLAADEIAIAKQDVEIGRVQVARVTREREQLIDEILARETAEISRIPVGRHLDSMPAVREEGDVIIVPNGVPHWFQKVPGPLNYYVVKVQ